MEDEKGNKFALKTIFINPFEEEKYCQELLCLQKLDHPNLIKMIDRQKSSEKCQIIL